MSDNRINTLSPARLSETVTVARQTPKTDFGDRVKAGLDQGAGALAQGASIMGGVLPGGAILSSAVSSVRQVAGSGAGAGAPTVGSGLSVSTQYLGTTGDASSFNPSTSGGGSGVSVGGSVTGTGSNDSLLADAMARNEKMITLQMQMQNENQQFTSISNILKTRHDTVKNSISNVR